MAGDEVGLKFQAVQVHGNFSVRFAGKEAVRFGEALEFARGDVACVP